MKEIGSEFWNVPVTNDAVASIIPERAQWYLSGRVALTSIIQDIKKRHPEIHTVSLPSYCCDSMIAPFLANQLVVSFYDVTFSESGIAVDWTSAYCSDVILIMEDYFGYSSSKAPEKLEGYHGFVIRDLTHSMMGKRKYGSADYYFGSLRKWCGFITGGFAFSASSDVLPNNNQERGQKVIRLRKQAMQQKLEYLQGRRSNKDYLKLFNTAEEELESIGISKNVIVADQTDVDLVKHLDVNVIRTRRRTNAEFLLEGLSNELAIDVIYPIFTTLSKDDVPLFIPVLIKNQPLRDSLRKYLTAHDIYCPIHWPVTSYHILTPKTQNIYNRELSIVCDQRYDLLDMRRIINTIRDFFENSQ